MKSQIRQGMKERSLWRDRLIRRRMSIIFMHGLFGVGSENHRIGDLLASFDLSAILFPLALGLVYLYFSYRFIHFIFLTSKTDPIHEESVTVSGRLKRVGDDDLSDSTPHSILEDARDSQIPNSLCIPLEVFLTPSNEQAEVLCDYLGKRLMVTGKIHFSGLKGKPEVVPELMMEVVP